MITVKWTTRWKADKMGLPSIEDYDLSKYKEFKACLTQNIIENHFIFSGENHVYGLGVPVFCLDGKPVANWIVLPDTWAKFMVSIWSVVLQTKFYALDFRSKNTLPKCVIIKYPMEDE